MNQQALQQKLKALTGFANLDVDTVNAVGKVLEGLGDWELLRINPLQFASQYGYPAAAMVDLFIHGAKVGLFDFVWNLLCPSCGAIVRSHASVNDMAESFHCALCHIDVPGNLDDQVEVAFAINPSVKKLDINPFGNPESYS